MAESKESLSVVENIIKPGNLIWGRTLIDEKEFRSIVSSGILPGDYVGKRGIRPYNVCLAMISKTIPNNQDKMLAYKTAGHKGPNGDDWGIPSSKSLNLAIVVDKNKLLQSFSGRVSAIGDYFHSNMGLHLFNIKKGDKDAYGVPISAAELYAEDPWLDEVVVKFPRESNGIKGITPDMWSGLVIPKDNFEELKKWLDNSQIRNVPVISSKGEVLLV